MDMVKELVGLFIEANHRLLRIVGERVSIENLFHAPDKVCAYLGDTPTLDLPRFEFVFFYDGKVCLRS